ncbi:TPA: hypothetical protein ACH3X2_000475 [Trebouxia sp. C0005]
MEKDYLTFQHKALPKRSLCWKASNPAGGSAQSVSGTGGTTSTGQFVIQTCSTTPAVLLAGSSASPSTGAVAATPGAQAAATAG